MREYREGDTAVAVKKFLAWSSGEVSGLRKTARREEQVAYESNLLGLSSHDSAWLASCVMLNTEVLLEQGPSEVHLNLASYCLRRLATRPEARPFMTSWKIMMASWLLASGRLDDAEELANAGDADAETLLLQGSIAEGVAQRLEAAKGERSGVVPRLATRRRDPFSTLTEAESNYRRALELDPNLLEARIRLGRVLTLQGKVEAASDVLTLAVSEAGEGYLAYLAALFLGQVHERAGRPVEARRCYEAAVREYPEGQTAYIALGQLLETIGEIETGRTSASRMFASRRDPERDPWWVYPDAQAWQMDRRLGTLREYARRPQ